MNNYDTRQTYADYLKIGAVGGEAIAAGRVSMLHMDAEVTRRAITEKDRWTHLVHLRLFQSPVYKERVTIWPGGDAFSWSSFCVQYGLCYVVNMAEDEVLDKMTEPLGAHPDTTRIAYLGDGIPGVVVRWNNTNKAWIDVMHEEYGIVDYIRTDRFTYGLDFARLAHRYGLHLHWGWLQEGVERVTGMKKKVTAVFQEHVAPHDVAVFEVDDEFVRLGREHASEIASMYQSVDKGIGLQSGIGRLMLPGLQ